MAAKSPTTSIRSSEIIGSDKFSRRREVFDNNDTGFVPLPSPTTVTPKYAAVETIITSNQGKTTSNFKRNTPTYSSMREPRNEEMVEFRQRKYSDNFTSERNQDDEDSRTSLVERHRRLSRMRREFLKSNLHDSNDGSFVRGKGVRSTINGPIKYEIKSPNLYKFPFAEPYSTPPPARRVLVDLGPADADDVEVRQKENQDPVKPKHQSLAVKLESPTKVDHQKLFEELVKRYSPQRKPVDWSLPPTKPRIVDAVRKSTTESVDSADTKKPVSVGNDAVFTKENASGNKALENGNANTDSDSKTDSPSELEEKKDKVPELSPLHKQMNLEPSHRANMEKVQDLNIPELLEKMNIEGQDLENHKNDKIKVKRKRSFIDKLLGRNKGDKITMKK